MVALSDEPVACCGGAAAAAAAFALAQIALMIVVVALLVVGIVAVAAYVSGWRPFGYPDEYVEKREAIRDSPAYELVEDHVERAGDRDPTGGVAFDELLDELAERGHDLSERELVWLIEDELDRRGEG